MWPTLNSLSPDNDGLWPERKGKLTFTHTSGCCFVRAFPWQPQMDQHKRVVGNRGIDLHPEHKEYSRTAFYRMVYTELLRRSKLLTSSLRLMLILGHFSARRCIWMLAFLLMITSNQINRLPDPSNEFRLTTTLLCWCLSIKKEHETTPPPSALVCYRSVIQ